jgi:subtilase family serine protease
MKMHALCGTMLAGVIAGSAMSADAAEKVAISGNIAPWVGNAARVAAIPDSREISIVVHMALRNPDSLRGFVDAVSKPSSPSYGKYLTVQGFRARFAPDPADVSATAALLKNAGMRNVTVGPAGAYVSADATAGQLSSTFGVTQALYSYRGRTLRANAELPKIPASLAGKIRGIEGLDETNLKFPHNISVTRGELRAPAGLSAQAAPAVTPPPVAASLPSPYCDTYMGDLKATLSTAPAPYATSLPWLNCGYTPAQIRAAYGLNQVKVDGTGVTVAIVDAFASPTLQADGNAYAKHYNLPQLTSSNFSQIIPEGIYNVPPASVSNAYGWWGEESLDLAAVHGSAPGANIVYIGSTDNGNSLTVALTNAVYNRAADIITNSYSYNGDVDPTTTATQDETFMVAASTGITLLFSSGDNGDLSQSNGIATGSFESDSAYVTGVGGTTLFLAGPSGRKGEWGWGTYRDYLAGATVNSGTSITTSGLTTTTAFGTTYPAFAFYSGAGGGISLVAPQPSYQAGIVPRALATTLWAASGYSATIAKKRVSPDVAMDADPYTGYLIGESFTIAGNSVSDAGCTPTSSTTEYCEIGFGGTSLASPLMAGMLAVVTQARLAAGKPLIGFANPWLYSGKIGTTLTASGINDVQAPAHPVALLRGYVNDLTRVRVVTVNSVPLNIETSPYARVICGAKICEGINDVFNNTTKGYDDVTGLGVPYAPVLVTQ